MAVRHGFGRVGRSVAGWGAATVRHQGESSAVPGQSRRGRGTSEARASRDNPHRCDHGTGEAGHLAARRRGLRWFHSICDNLRHSRTLRRTFADRLLVMLPGTGLRELAHGRLGGMPARSWSRRVHPGPHPRPCPHPCPHPHPRPPPVTPSCSRPPASPPCRPPCRPRVHDLTDHPSHQQVRIERACCGDPYWRDTRSTRRCFRRPAGLSRSMGDRRASGGPCAKPSGTPFGRDLAPTSETRSEPPNEACMEPSQLRPCAAGVSHGRPTG